MRLRLRVDHTSGPCAHVLVCTQTSTTVGLAPGYNVFYAAAYDGTSKGAGTLLSISTTGTAITIAPPPATNLVTVTMNGIVSNVNFGDTLVGSTMTVNVNGVDPDGNTITGTAPFANGPITVGFNDINAQFTGFPSAGKTFSAPGGSVTLAYQGANDCGATMTGTAPSLAIPAAYGGGSAGGVTNASATIQTSASTTYSKDSFGRERVCWKPFGSSPTQYFVYRGTHTAGESPTPIASVPSTVLGYDDYTVVSPNQYYYEICTGALGVTCTSEFHDTVTHSPVNLLVAGTPPTFWFDANDTSTIGSTNWNDKSTNANNLATTSVTSTANPYGQIYRNALTFGTGSYATTSSGNVATTLTIVAVASQSAASANSFERLVNLGTGDQRGFVGTYGSPALVTTYWGNNLMSPTYGACNGWCDTLPNGPATTWPWGGTGLPSIIEVVNDGTCPMYICGTTSGLMGPITYYNGTAMNQSQNGVMTSTTGMEIGAYSGNATAQSWHGIVDDILIYPSTLAQPRRRDVNTAQQVIEGYEACKWGYPSLPSRVASVLFRESCP